MKPTIVGATIGVCALALSLGCSTSSYQSAKMLPQGATRLTAAFSNYHMSSDGDDVGEPGYEIMGSHGLSDTMEIGGKLAYFDVGAGASDASFFHVMVIPKLSLTPDQLAVVLPVGIIMNDQEGGENVYEVMPGVVYSRQLIPEIELDATGQALILINDQFDDTLHYFGANVGIQLSPPGAVWAIHPELGLLIPVGDAADLDGDGVRDIDYIFHVGFAFHYRFGGPQASIAAPPPQ